MDFIARLLMSLLCLNIIINTANASDCLSQSDMADIAKHFPQFQNLGNSEYCFNDNSQTSELLRGIQFMRNTKFQQSMPVSSDQLFSGKFASDWWTYFIGRINKFQVQNNCPKGVIAYVMGGFFASKTMYVCPLGLTDAFSALDRASVFMHEARHIDGYPHITCTRGPRKGIQGACDDAITDTGSYSVTVETYAQLAKYAKDIHPALRAYAKSSGIIYADEAFETPVKIARQKEFLAMTSDRQFHKINFVNGLKVTPMGVSPSLGLINMRAESMVLYPDDKTLPAKYVFANNEGDVEQVPNADVSDYNKQTPDQKSTFVTAHSGAQWGARIFKTKMRMACSVTSSDVTEVPFNNGVPAAVLYPKGYDRVDRLEYLAMQDGSIMEFGCTENGSAIFQPSSLKFDQNFKRIHKAGDVVLGLNYEGKLFQINADGSSTALNSDLNGRVYELVPHQTYEFFD